MRWVPPAYRGYDVVSPITVYRVIGRRPSEVYVDDRYRPTTARPQAHRLWDLVFARASAEPGDQIQDRPGGIVLVTKDGECHPVQLTAPRPRSITTAFTHAEKTLSADRTLAEKMVGEGRLVAGSSRRLKGLPETPAEVKFEEDHPLVVDAAP